eukprot:scaffold23380_cov29-Tisochrysis_lutea.AAC.1
MVCWAYAMPLSNAWHERCPPRVDIARVNGVAGDGPLARPKVGVAWYKVEHGHRAWDDDLGGDEAVDQDTKA